MNPRRPGSGGLGTSPILIGGVTILVAVIAVFLSYNANNGLPFVPTYDLDVNVPNAAGLVRGNDVRSGGQRVGKVTKISAVPHKNGVVTARLHLALDTKVKRLSRDSTLMVRPKSALGLKYVELTEGRQKGGYAPDSQVPLSAAKVKPVEIDDFFNMFDDKTRVGSRTNLDEFGTGFAGRGPGLNRLFAQLEPLAREAQPALATINSPRSQFGRFFPALQQAASEVEPVAGVQGSLFVALNGTFEALDGVRGDVQESISEGPSSLDTATRELPAQRPFLASSTELFRRLRPGFASLSAASPDLAAAFRTGTPALLRSPALNRRFTRTLTALDRFSRDPRVPAGLRRLRRTADLANPLLTFATPAQTVCNYLTLTLRNAQSAVSESDQIGTSLRVTPMSVPQLPDSEFGPAAKAANGPYFNPSLRENSLRKDSFLHSNYYPNTAAPGQTRECEAGNEGYIQRRQVIGNVPGNQGIKTQPTKRNLR